MTEETLISIKGLSIGYASEDGMLTAVDNANLEIPPNKLVAVVGESGCGKSTLGLSIIGLLPTPPAKILNGSIYYKGTDLVQLNAKRRREFRGTEVAMIFQEPLTSLNPVYKVGDQIAEAIVVRELRKSKKSKGSKSNVMQSVYNSRSVGRFRKLRPRSRVPSALQEEVIESLKLVRIADPEQVVERYPFELSGGMRQRVMIAMALSQKPSLLIADEPTTALDVTTQAQVLKLMKELMNEVNTSIFLVSHDLAVASQVADEVVVMYAGEVVEHANVYDFFTEPLHPYSKGLLSCIPSGPKDETNLDPIPGNVPDPRNPPKGCRYAPRCPYVMEVCLQNRPRLIEAKPGRQVECFLYGK